MQTKGLLVPYKYSEAKSKRTIITAKLENLVSNAVYEFNIEYFDFMTF